MNAKRVVPIDALEEARRDAIRVLRGLARELERASRAQLADHLLRLPLVELDRHAEIFGRRREQSR